MAESYMEKRDVRLKMKEMRKQFPPAEAGVLSRLAGRRLDAFLVFMGARRVGIYAAVRGEMDFSSLWSEGSDAKRTYCFPRVGKDVLHFCPVSHPEAELQPGTLRIPEPVRDIPPLNVNELDVVVIPGLAFDLYGGRLGTGGGYYDRTFQGRRAGQGGSGPLLVGACYAFQLLVGGLWKHEAWDVDVDWVITDRGALRCLPREYMP
ncbi:MAG: 5-formyltetrahydrofolate cyclo-ligase [Nitrospinae bacterium]|nr:5-formyltetrahydrofolate cyclo-ligase [Nitrospinota bacterium]